MKSCLRFIIYSLSSSLIFIGSFLLIIRFNILNPEIYKREIRDIGIYKIIETQVTNSNAGEGFQEYLKFISTNLDTDVFLQDLVEKNIDNITNWLGNKSSELIIYFPKEQLAKSFSNTEIEKILVEGFISNIKNKRECTAAESQKFLVLNNVSSIEELNLDELDLPECTPQNFDQVDRLARDFFHEQFSKNTSGSVIDEALKVNGFENLDESTPISELKPEYSESANKVKMYIDISFVASILAIVVGILLAIINALISKTPSNRIKVFSLSFLFTGIIFTILGILTNVVAEFAIKRLPLEEIPIPTYLNLNKPELILHLKETSSDLIHALFNGMLPLGIIILILIITANILALILKKRNSEPKKLS